MATPTKVSELFWYLAVIELAAFWHNDEGRFPQDLGLVKVPLVQLPMRDMIHRRWSLRLFKIEVFATYRTKLLSLSALLIAIFTVPGKQLWD